ncbi:MAG: hypothetical protein AABW49_00890 [Nanoarchaeota archaeon]
MEQKNKRKEIICENCGAIYLSENIPHNLQCTCENTIFHFTNEVPA